MGQMVQIGIMDKDKVIILDLLGGEETKGLIKIQTQTLIQIQLQDLYL